MEARARVLMGAVYLAVAMVAHAAPALAADPPKVVVGEVGARVAGSSELPRALRRALERELSALSLGRAPRAKGFVLSASLVKLEHQADETVSCTVSVVLREQKGGAIRAILEGRARAA